MNMDTCPHCGRRLEDEADPTIARAAAFEEQCLEHGHVVAAGRVSESVAAELLGVRKRLLAHLRRTGEGPRATHLPVDGSSWSYTLMELAAFESAHHEGETWA